jgi:hypothetical protein
VRAQAGCRSAGAQQSLVSQQSRRDLQRCDVAKAGLIDAGWGTGVCVGDFNNDGFEDLFVTYYGQNKLYRNNGDGTFTDVTAKAGLLHPNTRFSTGCTFVDYNRDGLLDLFVANYVEFDVKTAPLPSLETPNCNFEGVAVYCGPRGLPAPQHYLLSQQWRRDVYGRIEGVWNRWDAGLLWVDCGYLRCR